MKTIIKIISFTLMIIMSFAVNAGEVTDTYTAGDTLTATKMTNIKDAVNENDSKITINTSNISFNTADISTNSVDISAFTSSQGYIFTRWGNATAPVNTSLVYSGYAFASHYSLAGSQTPIVLAANGTTSALANNSYLYPLKIDYVVSGSSLVSMSHVKASVNISPTPVVTIWGSVSIPTDWQELYRGYVYTGHPSHGGGIAEHLCIDNAGFQSDVLVNSTTSSSTLYPVHIPSIGSDLPTGYTSGNVIECIVVQKT